MVPSTRPANTAIHVPASRGAEPCVSSTLTSTAGSPASQARSVSSVGSVRAGMGLSLLSFGNKL